MVGYLQKSSTTIMRIKIKSASMSKCRENSEAFLFVFLNGDSLHARLSSHYKAWSYMIRKLQLRYRTLPKNCSFIYKFNVSGICEKLKQEFNNCMVSKNVYYFQLPKMHSSPTLICYFYAPFYASCKKQPAIIFFSKIC